MTAEKSKQAVDVEAYTRAKLHEQWAIEHGWTPPIRHDQTDQKPDAMKEKIAKWLREHSNYFLTEASVSDAQSLLDLILPELKAQLKKDGWQSSEETADQWAQRNEIMERAWQAKLNQALADERNKIGETLEGIVKYSFDDFDSILEGYINDLKSGQAGGE